MKTIPLTVLVSEGPQARAYLSRMRLAGYRPERILLLISDRHLITAKKAIGRLPQGLRLWYTEKSQEAAYNYWPRKIKFSYPFLVEAIIKEISGFSNNAEIVIKEMLGKFNYKDYADNVERVFVTNIFDAELVRVLSSSAPGAVLFAGGGILRSDVLELPGYKFIHVHPGLLPCVRGSDGVFWSMLVRGKVGFSAFYMSSKIDDGDLIASDEFKPFIFDITNMERPDDLTLYRSVFSFFDPVLRAEYFVNYVLTKGPNLCSLPTVIQNKSESSTYYFMNSRLLNRVLALMFKGRKN